jgi:hypothetical protein
MESEREEFEQEPPVEEQLLGRRVEVEEELEVTATIWI